MAGEKLTIRWVAGLRSASWEEDQTFNGTSNYYVGDPAYTNYPNYNYDQSKHIESDAFGVKVGLDLKFGFTQHFSLAGGMAFSFLQGSNDAEMNQTQTFYSGGLPVTTYVDQIKSSDNNIRGEIRDVDVRALWEYNNLGFWVGYGGQTWSGLVADPSGEEPCCSATRTAHSSRDSVAFNSIHAGVAFKFGGKKK
jgi:hypothetical protein